MSTVSMATVPLRDEVFAANRAIGRIALTVAASAGRSRPARVHESGSLRVRFPRCDGAVLDAVIVNTGGGMTGGDHFNLGIKVGAGADVSVTTAAAEKIYRSLGPDTVVDLNLTVGSGGRLAWLPQEMILFDRGRLRRKIDVDLAPQASLFLAEACIFGRSAMGETVRSGFFSDRWRVRIAGSLVFADAIRLDGAIVQSLAVPAAAAGGAAVASVLKVPGTGECVAAVRALQEDFIGEVGVSAWNGLVAVRCVAANGAVLRHDLAKVLAALGSGPLPRLWTN
jgi:urease accessory protein